MKRKHWNGMETKSDESCNCTNYKPTMWIRKFMVAIWRKECSRKLTAMTSGEVAGRAAMQQPEMET
jgi:hypothetical protein